MSIEQMGREHNDEIVRRASEPDPWHFDRTEYGWVIRDSRSRFIVVIDDPRHLREADARRICGMERAP